MAILHMPERVVAVTKRQRREISGRGCFAIATTRSGCFFRPFGLFALEHNIWYIYSYSRHMAQPAYIHAGLLMVEINAINLLVCKLETTRRLLPEHGSFDD
jgi:hypothetical protein